MLQQHASKEIDSESRQQTIRRSTFPKGYEDFNNEKWSIINAAPTLNELFFFVNKGERKTNKFCGFSQNMTSSAYVVDPNENTFGRTLYPRSFVIIPCVPS